jgi:hypothetical protein
MQVLCVVHLLLLYATTNSTNSFHSINIMASQRPARDIIRQDYHAIVNYKNDKPAHPPANPPANPLIDPILTAGLDDASTAELIPTTVATNSNIYDDLDDDSRVTLATSIQPLELVSQALPQVPQLQAKSQP